MGAHEPPPEATLHYGPSMNSRTRQILVLATPIVGGMISQNVLNLVDTAMVGSLGAAALAGVGIGGFANFMAVAAIMGLGSAVQAIAARRVGEGHPHNAADGLHAGLLAAIVVGVPLSIGLITLTPTFFPYLNDDPEVIAHGVPYLQTRLLAACAIGCNYSFRGFWNGVNRPGLYFQTLVFMHLSNIVISYALIFGAFGAPELGSLGAGIGTATSTFLGTAIYVFLGIAHGRELGFLKALPSRTTITSLARLAIPSSLQQFLFAAAYNVMFWIIGQIGTHEVAAASVLINIMLTAILPGLGLGLASASAVGLALGRDDPEDARRWGWDVVKVAIVAMMALGAPMWMAPEPILTFFMPTEPEAVALAILPLRIVGLFMFTDAVGMVLMNSLLGAGAARSVAAVAVSLQWFLFLPVAYLLGPMWGYGLVGVWTAQVVQRGLQAGALAWLWERGRWADIAV